MVLSLKGLPSLLEARHSAISVWPLWGGSERRIVLSGLEIGLHGHGPAQAGESQRAPH